VSRGRLSRLAGLVALVASTVALATPELASACAVCYGDPAAPMTHGMNNAILTLLAVVAVVQGGFVALFVSFWRRSRRLQRQRESLRLIEGGVR
jgi:uncharacterized membrane protein HdeD (DUF308 family)